MPTDYQYLIDRIENAMEEQGEPLSPKQTMILAGSLSGLQQLIEAFGLRETIERLKKTELTKEKTNER